MMKITDSFIVKGRGPVYVIDALPAELENGMEVCNKDGYIWRVCGIETHAMPRSHTNGKSAGLLLKGDTMPNIGETLAIYHRLAFD